MHDDYAYHCTTACHTAKPTSPLHALFKAPNALIIKWVHLPSGKLKAAKLWPKLAKALA